MDTKRGYSLFLIIRVIVRLLDLRAIRRQWRNSQKLNFNSVKERVFSLLPAISKCPIKINATALKHFPHSSSIPTHLTVVITYKDKKSSFKRNKSIKSKNINKCKRRVVKRLLIPFFLQIFTVITIKELIFFWGTMPRDQCPMAHGPAHFLFVFHSFGFRTAVCSHLYDSIWKSSTVNFFAFVNHFHVFQALFAFMFECRIEKIKSEWR